MRKLAEAERRHASTQLAAGQEAQAQAARIAAEDRRSQELAALEMERMRLAALPAIVAEMVKPAKEIKGISTTTCRDLAGAKAATGPRRLWGRPWMRSWTWP